MNLLSVVAAHSQLFISSLFCSLIVQQLQQQVQQLAQLAIYQQQQQEGEEER